MRKKQEILFVIVVLLSFLSIHAQVDATLTTKTKSLYQNLKVIQASSNFMFGQEFFNSFKYSGDLHSDETYSDCKAVTGQHPAVLGSDFHYYLEKNATERGYHTDAVKWAFQQGHVITFDWHLSARTTTSYECGTAPAGLAENIANTNGTDRAWFYGELDKVIDIINKDLVVGNDTIPIVFRPFHEMNGGWFWWGACSGLSASEYKVLYQLLVDYMKTRTKSVLFCWSPNTPFGETHYPGDDYVDVVGVDAYEVTEASLRTEVGKVVTFAEAHSKIAVFSETGNRTDAGTAAGDNSSRYWKDVILPGILNDPSGKAVHIAWVLTWINASWSYRYVPHAGSSAVAKQSFIDFKNSPYVLFKDELPFDMYAEPPVTAVSETNQTVDIYPIPANRDLLIEVKGFENPVSISLFDIMGKAISKIERSTDKIISQSTERLSPGAYVVIISDGIRTVKRKIIVSK